MIGRSPVAPGLRRALRRGAGLLVHATAVLCAVPAAPALTTALLDGVEPDVLLSVGAPVLVGTLAVQAVTSPRPVVAEPAMARAVLRACPVAVLVVLVLSLVLGAGWGATTAAATAVLALVAAPLSSALHRLLLLTRAGRRLAAARVVVLGEGAAADAARSLLGRLPHVELVRAEVGPDHPRRAAGQHDADRLDHVLVVGALATEALPELVPPGCSVSWVPAEQRLLGCGGVLHVLQGTALVDVPHRSRSRHSLSAKRCLDLGLATLLLVLALPALVLAAVAVRLDSPGPALFRQERVGQGGRAFVLYKLRTMHLGAQEAEAALVVAHGVDPRLFKLQHDPRVTRVGRLLRATSVDELPQLLNVVLGTMSLVGPRPLPASEAAHIAGHARRRFDVPPGMTGLWQVSGRNALPYDDMLALDEAYVSARSLALDVRLLLRTPRAVLDPRGAF